MKIISLLLVLIALPIKAEILSVHCPIGCPSNPEGNDLLFGHVYALSNNPTTKFADWVAYEVNVLNFGNSPGRNWKTDPLLEEDETLEIGDYKEAHKELEMNKGHQAPLATFAGSQYWYELNYLSNITPQHEDLNQGPWKDLEDAVRRAVSYRKPLYVFTGPIFGETDRVLPKADEEHQFPTAYFKIIYNKAGQAAVFIMTQETERNANYCNQNSNFDELKNLTSLEFSFLSLDSAIRLQLGCS